MEIAVFCCACLFLAMEKTMPQPQVVTGNLLSLGSFWAKLVGCDCGVLLYAIPMEAAHCHECTALGSLGQ